MDETLTQLSSDDLPTQDHVTAWYDIAAKFDQAERYLLSWGPWVNSHPEFIKTWQALVVKAVEIRNNITAITSKIQAVKQALGLAGFSRLAGLGAIQVPIGAAILVASIAFIAKFIADIYSETSRYQKVQDLISQGVTPTEASRIVSDAVNKPLINQFIDSTTLKYLVIGGVIILFWPQISKRLN